MVKQTDIYRDPVWDEIEYNHHKNILKIFCSRKSHQKRTNWSRAKHIVNRS